MPPVRLLPSIIIALISVITFILWGRTHVFYSFYANDPSRMKYLNNLLRLETKFTDIVRNCEDVTIDAEQGFALLSCDPGRDSWNTVMGHFIDPRAPPETGLYLWNYVDGSSSSKPEALKLLDFVREPDAFHPLGIDYHAPSNTIFVANHAEAGPSIEIFKLFAAEKAATHIGSIRHRLIKTPNAIASVSEKEFYFTNDHYFVRRHNPMLVALEGIFGVAAASVVHVDLQDAQRAPGPKIMTVSRLPIANGIVLLNKTALAVASSTLNSVSIYRIDSKAKTGDVQLLLTTSFKVPYFPDNLSVDDNGTLLIAGHPHLPTLEKIAKISARCNDPGETDRQDCDVRGLSWISEWSKKGVLRTLYAGDAYGTSSTAARDIGRKRGIAVGLYERGILTWTD